MKLYFAGECIVRHCLKRKEKKCACFTCRDCKHGRKRSSCALCGTRRPGYQGSRSVQDGDDFTNFTDLWNLTNTLELGNVNSLTVYE